MPADSQVILHALTPRMRKVCALHWFDGVSRREIARRFASTPQAVKQMIWRACQRLRAVGIEPPASPPLRRVTLAQLSTCQDMVA